MNEIETKKKDGSDYASKPVMVGIDPETKREVEMFIKKMKQHSDPLLRLLRPTYRDAITALVYYGMKYLEDNEKGEEK